MGIKVSREIRCPNCDNFRTKNGKDFADHIYNVHTFKCMDGMPAGWVFIKRGIADAFSRSA